MLYSNQMNAATKKNDMEAEDKVIQVYKWSIETELGSFTGTCLSMDGVNEEITLLTNNAKILKKNIIPMSLINEDLGNKVYTWNIITNSGQASGVSVNLEEAIRVVNSFGSTEEVKSNIDESFKILK
ncbi:hypothetical protein CSW08_04980 [Confluentibacter flavum]|uniref:Uncharacterized protein n=2 Tax=Confluentibacter flavum TaxID=1909700 RepID=A0A2N3HMA9_9FLAO|nr:hypothetical protein CSW08_04980 [Confluentibacter flavum]